MSVCLSILLLYFIIIMFHPMEGRPVGASPAQAGGSRLRLGQSLQCRPVCAPPTGLCMSAFLSSRAPSSILETGSLPCWGGRGPLLRTELRGRKRSQLARACPGGFATLALAQLSCSVSFHKCQVMLGGRTAAGSGQAGSPWPCPQVKSSVLSPKLKRC